MNDMTREHKRTKVGTILFCLLLILVAGYVWWASASFPAEAQSWPRVLALTLAVSSIGVVGTEMYALRTSLRGSSQTHSEPQSPILDPPSNEIEEDNVNMSWAAAVRTLGSIVAFVVLAYLVSLIIAVPLYVLCALFFSKYRDRKLILLGVPVGVTLVTYIVFGLLTNMPLGSGVLFSVDLPFV